MRTCRSVLPSSLGAAAVCRFARRAREDEASEVGYYLRKLDQRDETIRHLQATVECACRPLARQAHRMLTAATAVHALRRRLSSQLSAARAREEEQQLRHKEALIKMERESRGLRSRCEA